jgi:hypothetical protein
MHTTAQKSLKVVATSDDLRRLRPLVARLGERRASQSLGVSSHAIARVLAGFSVHASTLFVIRARLAADSAVRS